MTPNPNDFPASIFTNTSAFGLMQHADELRRWHGAGGEVQWYGHDGIWREKGVPSADLARGNVYRAVRPALIPFHVPDEVWRVLGPRWKFAARDEGGEVFLYEKEPMRDGVVWFCGGAQRRVNDLFPAIIVGTVPWTEAIVQRPEGV